MRSYDNDNDLGTGYVMMTAKLFSIKHPENDASFINRGIGGNTVNDLRKRWQKDCVNLKPDVVTILVGINDLFASKVLFWEKATSNRDFERDYSTLLEQTRDSLDAKTVLMEPFVLNTNRHRLKLRKKLSPKIEIIRRLSVEFESILIPLSTIFQEAEKVKEPAFWSTDGVHPSIEGHKLIAESWIRAVAGSLWFM